MNKLELMEQKEAMQRELEFSKIQITLLEGHIEKGKRDMIKEEYIDAIQNSLDIIKEKNKKLITEIQKIEQELIK